MTGSCKNAWPYGDHRIRGREGTVNELFAEEQGRLLPLPAAPITVIQITTGKVDSYATVIVDKNRYSVPTFSAGLKVPGPAGRGARRDLP